MASGIRGLRLLRVASEAKAGRITVRRTPGRGAQLDSRMVAAPQLHLVGVTGFDKVGLRWAAGRGLLATLNRGTVKLIGKNNSQSAPALAMAA